MANTEEKIAALVRAQTAIQTELGPLQQTITDKAAQYSDDRQRQTAAMNIVVDQARIEFQGVSTAISNQSSEIKMVDESMAELQSIKQGCEDFGNKVERCATKVETKKKASRPQLPSGLLFYFLGDF